MARIKLTKTELKAQSDALKRYMRFLPMLQLKKQQLQGEIATIVAAAEAVAAKEASRREALARWAGLFAGESALLDGLVKVKSLKTATANIAGVAIPVFESIETETREIDAWATPPWIDDAAAAAAEMLALRSEREVYDEQRRLVEEELRQTSQRVNLFEKVRGDPRDKDRAGRRADRRRDAREDRQIAHAAGGVRFRRGGRAMIVPMLHLDLLCVASEKDATLEKLRALGAVHIDLSGAEGAEAAAARAGAADAERAVRFIRKAREGLEYASSFKAQPHGVAEILALEERREALAADIAALDREIARIAPFGDFDPALAAELSAKLGGELEKTVRLPSPLPAKSLSALRDERREAEGALVETTAKLASSDDQAVIAQYPGLADAMAFAAAKEKMESLGVTCHIEGWIAAPKEKEFSAAVRANGWGALLRKPASGENPPTLIEPPKLFRPVKALFAGLGVAPQTGELPTEYAVRINEDYADISKHKITDVMDLIEKEEFGGTLSFRELGTLAEYLKEIQSSVYAALPLFEKIRMRYFMNVV